jgi:hypothetical protein
MKSYRTILPLLAATLWLSACSTAYQGTLVDARNYLNFNADGHSPAQQYSAFYAMKANLPAGILLGKDKFVLLSNSSSQLAKYSSLEVKAKGKYLPKEKILKATEFWAKTETGWVQVPIR